MATSGTVRNLTECGRRAEIIDCRSARLQRTIHRVPTSKRADLQSTGDAHEGQHDEVLRSAVCRAGADATQVRLPAGETPQFALRKSTIRSAVVFGSTLTCFNSGGGGALALSHSSTISARAPALPRITKAAAVIRGKRLPICLLPFSLESIWFELCRCVLDATGGAVFPGVS